MNAAEAACALQSCQATGSLASNASVGTYPVPNFLLESPVRLKSHAGFGAGERP